MDAAEPFPDNWTYLRTELNWLDRVLANAIARQRKETKEVERVARTKADYVTSHWWKGLLNLDGPVAGDSPAELPTQRTGVKAGYQQQMEARIRASRAQGIVLGLPALCYRLELSTFEKNLVLMALAPEVNRRYARIYNFLQELELAGAAGLPTVDLILRLLCRNDGEWRSARLALASGSRLVQHGIVQFPDNRTEPFLAHVVKLADPWVEFLLAETPALVTLEQFLVEDRAVVTALVETQPQPTLLEDPVLTIEPWQPERAIAPAPTLTSLTMPKVQIIAPDQADCGEGWPSLVLPKSILATLRHLGDRIQYAEHVDSTWGFNTRTLPADHKPGTVALLAGTSGTGKTMAARAIAQSLDLPLHCLDLAIVPIQQASDLLQQWREQPPTLLLLKSAALWFGRSAPIPVEHLQQFLLARQHTCSLTFLSVEQASSIKALWRQQLDQEILFPWPNQTARRQLWHQAFPASAPLANDLDWQTVATWRLTGKDIAAIARDAAFYAAADSAAAIGLEHLKQAYTRHQTKHGQRQKL